MLDSSHAGTREPGVGGGAVRATYPPNLEALGASPPTLDCRCPSFLFLIVFAREPGSLPKNSRRNPESFSFWVDRVTLDPGTVRWKGSEGSKLAKHTT